jgi:hypothetical protein
MGRKGLGERRYRAYLRGGEDVQRHLPGMRCCRLVRFIIERIGAQTGLGILAMEVEWWE